MSNGSDGKSRSDAGGRANPGSCEDALERINEFLDGALSDLPHATVAEHFRVCLRCYPHLVMERSFRNAVRRALESQAAPAALRIAVIRALENDTP